MVNRIIIKIILLFCILAFCTYLYASAQTYECNQCSVSFSNSKALPTKYIMEDLFEESKLDRCPVYWDRVGGYVKG